MDIVKTINYADYQTFDTDTLITYLYEIESVRNTLGDSADNWHVSEIGDGNLNLVFIVSNNHKKLIVKQALPYLRLVGESWPLPLKRSFFEATALRIENQHVSKLIPEVIHTDTSNALIVMEYCYPHIILRKGFIQGLIYPKLSEHISTFLAETLFKTSDLYLKAKDKKQISAIFCDNTELCKITEDLVFNHPYLDDPHNRWTSPELDSIAKQFKQDSKLKFAAQEMKEKFLSHAQALIHGDLHSGSIMVTADKTKVIDPEFAFFGPMGFDIGAYMANVLLAYFSQTGHEKKSSDRTEYKLWLLSQVNETWNKFHEKFTMLWDTEANGDCYGINLGTSPHDLIALKQTQTRYMERLLHDSLGFSAVKMIRRILGLAHVEDMESITNEKLRAKCETSALNFARTLLLNRDTIHTIDEVTQLAKEF